MQKAITLYVSNYRVTSQEPKGTFGDALHIFTFEEKRCPNLHLGRVRAIRLPGRSSAAPLCAQKDESEDYINYQIRLVNERCDFVFGGG